MRPHLRYCTFVLVSRCWQTVHAQPHCVGPAMAHADHISHAVAVFDIADIDAATARTIAQVVQPFLVVTQLLMISRIVLSWCAQAQSKEIRISPKSLLPRPPIPCFDK
jgi:hypothetical protein